MSTQNTVPLAEATIPTSVTRIQQHRTYLMCRPEHFTVSYRINPWMEPANPDRHRARRAPVAVAVRHVPRARPRRRS